MFKFGERSLRKLQGVHLDLLEVTHKALSLSKIDFGITEGVRSLERQKILLDTGATKTLNSRHLTGHAVDVVAYVNGYTYEPFELYTSIAEAYREAAMELGVDIVWGAAWLKALNYYDSAAQAKQDYMATRWSQGRRPFLDGPHFQLTRKDYP